MARKVVVGAHPWVYAARRQPRTISPILDQVFADMSAAGFDGIELMPDALADDAGVERVRGLSEKHSLAVIGTSWGGAMWDRARHDQILADARGLLPRLAAVGGRTLGTSVGRPPEPKTDEQLDAQADLLKQLIPLCEEHGVVLNLHNHTYEVENGEHDLGGTLARVPEVKLGPDLNWLLRAGVDPVDFIRRHADSIVFLHLRDQKADGTWPEAMGEGDTDHARIAAALREIGFAGDAVIELAHERDFELTRPLGESLRMSRDYVRRAMGY
jgi:sugar phosphate isomerase/epimerase